MVQLLILAAGLGSRFRGPKQLENIVDRNSLLDYAMRDALAVGFEEIIMVIRPEHLQIFKEKYPYPFVKFALQETPANREKPMGTAHAVYSALDLLDNKFAVINGDDFYGRSSFLKAYQHLVSTGILGMIAYPLKETLSNNGPVMRGKCTHADGYLIDIEEEAFSQDDGSVVSMNFWCLQNVHHDMIKAFDTLELKQDEEWYLPDFIKSLLKEKACKLIQADSSWCGITYPEDLAHVKKVIETYTRKGVYEKDLFRQYRQ